MNKQLFPASGILAINAVAENMPFTLLEFSGCKKFRSIYADTGQERCRSQSPSRYCPSRPSLFQKFRKLFDFMVILPITNKDATRQAKLSQVASFCNFPQDVGIVGGGEGS